MTKPAAKSKDLTAACLALKPQRGEILITRGPTGPLPAGVMVLRLADESVVKLTTAEMFELGWVRRK